MAKTSLDPSVLSGATSLTRFMVGDGSVPRGQTYATSFSTPSGDYTFVPSSVINKGLVYGDNVYWLPAALDKNSLKSFGSQATYVDLASVPHSGITSVGDSWGDWLAKSGLSTTGYLVPGSNPILDSGGISSAPTSQIGSISRIAQDASGNYVYATTSGHGNQYINNAGEVHDPYTTYSSPFGSFGVSVAQALRGLGPVGLLGAGIFLPELLPELLSSEAAGAAALEGVSDAALLGGEYAGGLGAADALTGGISDAAALGGEYAADVGAAVASPVASGSIAETPLPSLPSDASLAADNIDAGGGWNPAAASDASQTAGLPSLAADNIDAGGGWNPAAASDASQTAGLPSLDAGSLGTASDFGTAAETAGAEEVAAAQAASQATPTPWLNGMETENAISGPGVAGADVPTGTYQGGANFLSGMEETAATEGAGVAGTGLPTGAGSTGFLPSIADATGLPLGVVQGLAATLGLKALGSVLSPDQGAAPAQPGGGSPIGASLSASYQPYRYKPYDLMGNTEFDPQTGAPTGSNLFPKGITALPTQFAQQPQPIPAPQTDGFIPPPAPLNRALMPGGEESYQQPTAEQMAAVSGKTLAQMFPGGEYKLSAYAGGGIANLGGYSDGGRLLRGPGDGVSDSIPATVADRQPARLADGEFVIPARIVSELGNGSTDAGARKLYAMMDRVQKARRKTTGKDQFSVDSKAAKGLPA